MTAHNFFDMTGMKFGLLTVHERTGTSSQGTAMWRCTCDCGNEIIQSGARIRRGVAKSCGSRIHLKIYTKETFRNFVKVKDSGCWEWTGRRDDHGYGFIRQGRGGLKSKRYPAHRMAFDWFKGGIPEGMLVLHECDNPPCVNPDHLRLGTQADNMRDMKMKGRAPHGRKKNPLVQMQRLAALQEQPR